MYIYTHRRYSAKSAITGTGASGGVLFIPDEISEPQYENPKQLLTNGFIKMFSYGDIDDIYTLGNFYYGPHIFILQDPGQLEDIPDEVYNFVMDYYKTSKRKPYIPINSREDVEYLLNPPDIEENPLGWQDALLVDAIRNEFPTLGFILEDGAVTLRPQEVDMIYHFDEDFYNIIPEDHDEIESDEDIENREEHTSEAFERFKKKIKNMLS